MLNKTAVACQMTVELWGAAEEIDRKATNYRKAMITLPGFTENFSKIWGGVISPNVLPGHFKGFLTG